jgi:uncharacterized protein (TIGR02271 family)
MHKETRLSMAYEGHVGGIEQFRMIRPSWQIVGSDGENIGTVASVEEDYFIVSEGFFFPSERYIPAAAVRAVEEGTVLLSVTKGEIDARGWNTLESIRMEQASPQSEQGHTTPEQREDADAAHLDIREEELHVEKRTVQSGEVDVSKDVVTEREEFDVPRRHEEVEIDYRPSATHRPAEGQIGDDEEIRVPLHEEQINVHKETVVTGEVDVSKHDVEETEHVSEEVRKERLRVEREGDVDVKGANPDQNRSH